MKKNYDTMKILLVYLLILFGLILLSSCGGPIKPDVVKGGKEYVVREVCLEGHNESKYDYHYGYNLMKGKYEWHLGNHTEWICDSMALDTIEVNKEKKYYETNH